MPGAEIASIVDFESPPVVEVVLGVQFDTPVVDLEVLAEFALAIKPTFPDRQQVDPLPRAVESFDRPPQQNIELLFGGGPPLPRTWFLGDGGRLLLQLQSDRLVMNWRRLEPGDAYVRYETLRPKFDEIRTLLEQVMMRVKGTPIAVDHVEVSYSNELAIDEWSDGHSHPPLAHFLVPLSNQRNTPDTSLPDPEDSTFQSRYRMLAPDGTLARLVVQADAAYRSFDLAPIYLLKLSSFITGRLHTSNEVIAALDLGREWVVRGFLDVVRDEVQDAWGKV